MKLLGLIRTNSFCFFFVSFFLLRVVMVGIKFLRLFCLQFSYQHWLQQTTTCQENVSYLMLQQFFKNHNSDMYSCLEYYKIAHLTVEKALLVMNVCNCFITRPSLVEVFGIRVQSATWKNLISFILRFRVTNESIVITYP